MAARMRRDRERSLSSTPAAVRTDSAAKAAHSASSEGPSRSGSGGWLRAIGTGSVVVAFCSAKVSSSRVRRRVHSGMRLARWRAAGHPAASPAASPSSSPSIRRGPAGAGPGVASARGSAVAVAVAVRGCAPRGAAGPAGAGPGGAAVAAGGTVSGPAVASVGAVRACVRGGAACPAAVGSGAGGLSSPPPLPDTGGGLPGPRTGAADTSAGPGAAWPRTPVAARRNSGTGTSRPRAGSGPQAAGATGSPASWVRVSPSGGRAARAPSWGVASSGGAVGGRGGFVVVAGEVEGEVGGEVGVRVIGGSRFPG